MSPDSPHYQFDPDSVGRLHRKVEKEDFVTPANLAQIGNADRGAFADPVYQEQVLLVLEGRLPARRGRPPEDLMMWWKTVMADVLIEECAVASLKPNARNARTHSSAQLKKLEASIRRFGFVKGEAQQLGRDARKRITFDNMSWGRKWSASFWR